MDYDFTVLLLIGFVTVLHKHKTQQINRSHQLLIKPQQSNWLIWKSNCDKQLLILFMRIRNLVIVYIMLSQMYMNICKFQSCMCNANL